MKEYIFLIVIFLMGVFGGYAIFSDNTPYCANCGYSDGVNIGYDLNGTVISNTTYHNEYICCNFDITDITKEEYDALNVAGVSE